MNRNFRLTAALAAITAAFFCLAAPVHAADLPADVQAKVEKAKKRLTELAADPGLVAAVREANAHEPSMTNGKWVDVSDSDPLVKAVLSTKTSVQIAKWEKADDSVNKLILRDQKGNLVAASVRPLIWNNASRPVFSNPIKGHVWAANEIKPDTSTQIPSVHVAAPVMDGGKAIGVLQAGVTAN
jgi:hypothetical protein